MLVRTPSPYATESLFGYLLRASETNGYESPGELLLITGLPGHRITLNSLPLKKLSELLDQELMALQHLTYRTSPDRASTLKILNHNLGRHAKDSPLRLKQSAFCPLCVKENGYVDAFWDLSIALACPKHQCQVLSHCPECNHELKLFRPGLLTCSCGADLSHPILQQATKPLLNLMCVIHNKLHRTSDSELTSCSGLPTEFIKSMPLNSLLLTINRLGLFNLESKREPSSTDAETITNAAIEILSNWPHEYYEFLQRLGNKYISENPSAVGIRKQFNPFYSAMFERPFSSDIDFVREEFINFGLNIWGKGTVNQKLLRTSKPAVEQRFVSKAEFARRFGIWKPVMDRLIREGSLVTEEIQIGNITKTVVDIKLSQPPVQSQGIVSDREAAVFLGLPVRVIHHLRKVGLYKTKPRSGFAQSWHRDDAEEFLHHGLNLADKVKAMPEDAVTLGAMMRLALRDSSAKADIVAAAFDGRLKTLGRTGDKLSNLLLNKDEIDDFILNKRVEVESNSFSFPEASERTGIDSSAINSAVDLEILKTIDRGERIRITAESINEFNTNFITLSRLAITLETTARRLVNLCKTHDIPATSLARSGAKAKQCLISKKNIPELLAAHRVKKRRKDRRTEFRFIMEKRKQAYEASLTQYLNSLREEGKNLPRRSSGKPLKTAIANACGFSRDILYDYPSVIQILNEYDHAELQGLKLDSLGPVSKLTKYFKAYGENGLPLPRSRGQQLNKSIIARSCGFDRNTFYNNKKVAVILDAEENDSINFN